MTRPPLSLVEADPVATLVRAVRASQAALAAHLEPGGASERETITRILAELDDEKVVAALRALEAPARR